MAGTILLVSPNVWSRKRMERWLRDAGFRTESVATFEEARPRLTAAGPDALVTDVRLGEFNGLHLAIVGRDRRASMVAIVVGGIDAVLMREAERHGAIYLTEPVTAEGLVARLTVLLDGVGRHRRWPRKHLATAVDVEFGDSPARIVDLSYGGLQLEVADGAQAPEPGSGYHLSLPTLGVSFDAALVWVRRAASGQLLYGAAVDRTNPQAATAWRRVVDQVGFSLH